MKKPPKAVHRQITQSFLADRAAYAQACGHNKQKWVEFCEVMLKEGFCLYLYEAKESLSKYVTVQRQSRKFKVRFSNHVPHVDRQNDCDFVVGKNRGMITNTEQAVKATRLFFQTFEG